MFGDSGNDSLWNKGKNTTVLGGDGDDTLLNYKNGYLYGVLIYSDGGENVKIDGGKGNEYVRNVSNKVTILGGEGNDTILNSKWQNGADSILIDGDTNDDSIGNSDNNCTILGGDGNDTIFGFNATSTLNITGGEYSSIKSCNDIIVTIGKGKIYLVGAASLSAVNIKGKTTTTLTVTNKTKSPLTVDSSIIVINASKRTKAVKITGNNLANTILGGSGKDTIYGNAGNDSIIGNAGNDSLSGSKDIITDYAEGDKISIASGTAKAEINGNNLIFIVGNGKISVKVGKGKSVKYIDKDGEHVYPDTDDNPNVSIGNNGSTVKLLKGYLKESFDVANYGDALQTIDATAVVRDISLKGNSLMNSIIGGAGNDTLIGGNDVITDYTEDDVIEISSAKVSNIKSGGSDIIFTVGKGKITVTGGKGKVISYVDSTGEHTYPRSR